MSGALAGRLRERVTILRRATARDALGGAGGWEEIGAAWAGFAPAGHAGDVAGEAIAARPRWRATLRPRDILPGDRVLRGAVLLRVRRVTRDPGMRDRILIDAEELA